MSKQKGTNEKEIDGNRTSYIEDSAIKTVIEELSTIEISNGMEKTRNLTHQLQEIVSFLRAV